MKNKKHGKKQNLYDEHGKTKWLAKLNHGKIHLQNISQCLW